MSSPKKTVVPEVAPEAPPVEAPIAPPVAEAAKVSSPDGPNPLHALVVGGDGQPVALNPVKRAPVVYRMPSGNLCEDF